MSNPGTNPASIWTTVIGQLKTGVITNFATFVAEASAEGAALVGQEAQDFGALIDNFTQAVEAGTAPQEAWTAALGPYEAQAKSDAWKVAVSALAEVTSFVDSLVKIIAAAL